MAFSVDCHRPESGRYPGDKFAALNGAHAISMAPMTIDLRSAIDAWQEAVADAQAAEKLLDQTWHYYLYQRGPAVTEGLVKEVALFRNRAAARLSRALALMNATSDQSPT